MRRILKLPEQPLSQAGLLLDREEIPPVVQELHDVGLAAQDAWEIWRQGFTYVELGRRPTDMEFETYLREKIHLLKKQPVGKIKNPMGFLLDAIRKNYTNVEFVSLQRTKAQIAHAKTLEKLQYEKEHIEGEKQQQLHQICRQIVCESPEIVEDFLQALFVEEPFFRHMYDSSRTLLENYQDHIFLSVRIDTHLMQQYPDKFQIPPEL